MSIKSVIFDAYGTLLKINTPKNPYLQLLKQFDLPIHKAIQIAMTSDVPIHELHPLIQENHFPQYLKSIQKALKHELDSITPFGESLQVLEQMKKKHYKIAVISNLAPPYAASILEYFQNLVDVFVFSFQVGFTKPSHEIYHIALKKLGCQPNETLMVGDSFRNDYLAPKSLKMNALFLDRSKSKRNADINSLLEVFPYLEASL